MNWKIDMSEQQWHRVRLGWRSEIESHIVTKESLHTVTYINEYDRNVRENKSSRDHAWFSDFSKAKSWAVARQGEIVDRKKMALSDAEIAFKYFKDIEDVN